MLKLPYRQGEKPQTHYGLPHSQLDQNPPDDVYARLKAKAFDFEFVERRPSIISVPGAEALWLLEEGGHSCEEAFMRGNEFAHIHPPDDGSLHLMLPENEVSELLETRWGEYHPLVPKGRMPPTTVMVFGPRNLGELDVVLDIIEASYKFARG